MRVVAVVLAAGKSERMGENKLLLKLHGKTLIEHILDALKASKIDEIIVVLGHKPWEVTDVIKSRSNRTKIVINERYEEGMTTSLKKGLRRIENADAALLTLGDQLILDPTFLNDMIEQMELSKNETLIVCPVHKGRKGHPVLLSKDLFPEIENLGANEAISAVIHRHSDSLDTIEGSMWTVMDIDTPRDFLEAMQYLDERASSIH